jgi:hypothetical protein
MKQIAILGMIAALLLGCGKEDDSLAKKTGEKVGQQLTDFTKGIGKGIDQQMMVQVSLSPQVQALGLTNTIAKSHGLGSRTNGISIYLIASHSVSNTLIARALTAEGVEVGRSRKLLVMQKDDATYVTFDFESQMDMAIVKKYEIGL